MRVHPARHRRSMSCTPTPASELPGPEAGVSAQSVTIPVSGPQIRWALKPSWRRVMVLCAWRGDRAGIPDPVRQDRRAVLHRHQPGHYPGPGWHSLLGRFTGEVVHPVHDRPRRQPIPSRFPGEVLGPARRGA
jgi:hypothetical protein